MGEIVFLSHGGPLVGMGHVIRCLSLAKQFRIKGKQVLFISKFAVGQQIIMSEGFKVLPLVDDNEIEEKQFCYGNSESLKIEWRQLNKLLPTLSADAIIVDSYNVETWFFKELKEYTKCLVYIDDLHIMDYPVDVIINGNINAQKLKYPIIEGQRRLLGLSYNLIRSEFKGIQDRNKEQRSWNRILISTGASDPYDFTKIVLSYLVNLKEFQELEIKVVLGQAFQKERNKKNIIFYQKYSNIKFYDSPNDISDLMKRSDYAITAGGSTIYELFACGVIPIAFIYAKNQEKIISEALGLGYLFSIGRYDELNEEKFISLWKKVMEHKELNNEIVKRIQTAVDCKGTERIVNIILDY